MNSLSTRAYNLLAMIRDPQSDVYKYDFRRDGPWMALTRVPNIGPKTCAELVESGILVERPRDHWSGYDKRWYRLTTPKVEPLPTSRISEISGWHELAS
jgi:hypothetical protein